MIVIADTTPLNYLIQLGVADILADLYGVVIVPTAVLKELQHPDTPADVLAWIAGRPAWLQERAVQRLDDRLDQGLGPGEREAISLAMELHADVLLIDELMGRKEAEARNLVVTGTLNILMQASLLGRCEYADAVQRLRALGFWVSSAVEALMFKRHAEMLSRRRQ